METLTRTTPSAPARRRRTTTWALVLACVAILLPAAPASAAGSFTFDGTFQAGVFACQFENKKSGTIKIRSSAYKCPGGNYGKHYYVTLQKKSGLAWKNNGTFMLNCSSTVETYNWTGRASGQYRVYITKNNDGQVMSVKGTINHQ